MIKKIICFVSIIFLVSCSKKNVIDQSINSKPTSNYTVEVDDLSELIDINVLTKDSQIGSQSIYFKLVSLGKVIKKRIYLKNNLNSSLLLNIDVMNNAIVNSPFSIVKNTCESVLSVNKNCYIDFSLIYNESLSYSPITFKLYEDSANIDFGKITLIGNKENISTPQKSITFIKVGQLPSMNSDKSIRVYIKNTGDKIGNPQIIIPSEFMISKTDCNMALKKDKVCFIDLKINPSIDPNVIGVNKEIIFDGLKFGIIAGTNTSLGNVSCNSNFSNIGGLCVSNNSNCLDGNVKVGNSCVSITNYYNINCNCYLNVPYIPNLSSFAIDGLQNTGIGYQTMDLYLPLGSSNLIGSGKLIFYSHAMGETKTLDSWYENDLKEEALSKGYAFASIEFRHPILESEEIGILDNQSDLIHALRTIRSSYNFMKMSNPNNVYSFSYSKGSLLLANILSNNTLLNDSFGKISIKKMYILDGQITYNFDTYYNIYMNKSSIPLYVGPFPVGSMDAYQAFGLVNASAKEMTGMELTQNLNVIDAYRFLINASNMAQLSTASLPDIFFSYNSKNKNRLLSSQDLSATKFVNITIIPEEVDYLLHNPQAISLFCSLYSSYGKNCAGQDDQGYILNINSILDFFEQ